MANYNYVAPIQYKSYSDMNKERLAAKAVKEAAGLKQQSAIDKRRQASLSAISNVDMTGWATVHSDDFLAWAEKAKYDLKYTDNPDIDLIATKLIDMKGVADEHAKLRDKEEEYMLYIGENASNYDADLDWGISATHDIDGYKKRTKTFNNVGLLNYSNGVGDFPNMDYDPSATSGIESMKTMAEVANFLNITPTEGPNGTTFFINPQTEEKMLVRGGSFEVAIEQFSGLWNPDLSPLTPHRPEVAFSSYSNAEESNIFVEHAKLLNNKVEAREEGYSYEEAQAALKANILSYLNPDSALADRALMADAIHDYQLPTEQGGTGQTWATVSQSQTLIDLHGNPWERFADKMVDTADLYDPDKPSGGRNQNEQDRRLLAFGSAPVNEPDRQFARELGGEDYDWDEALKMSERGDAILKLSTLEDEVDVNGNFTGVTKRVLKDLGEGVRVRMGQQDIKFDAVPIDNVEVFPDENLAIVYATGDNPGEVGIDIGEEGDPWRYNPLFGGKEGIAPFRVINVLKDDGTYTEDYKRLMNQFDRTYGYENALQSKIISAEEARE